MLRKNEYHITTDEEEKNWHSNELSKLAHGIKKMYRERRVEVRREVEKKGEEKKRKLL